MAMMGWPLVRKFQFCRPILEQYVGAARRFAAARVAALAQSHVRDDLWRSFAPPCYLLFADAVNVTQTQVAHLSTYPVRLTSMSGSGEDR